MCCGSFSLASELTACRRFIAYNDDEEPSLPLKLDAVNLQ